MTLYFLIGPTAVGKTAAAIEWAKARGTEILCADAPLVYRGMDIGTAKPTPAEREAVVHHGLDFVGVRESFSVADYIAAAKSVVAAAQARGQSLLVVGGSGFYLKSFFEPVTDGVAVEEEVVERARELLAKEGLEGLLRELRKAGGENLEGLDVKNPRRVVKALERVWATGRSFRELREDFLRQPEPYAGIEKKVVMLTRERDDLERRIRQRVEAMIQEGLAEEVRGLKEAGLEENPQAASVIGYRETLDFLAGRLTSLEGLKAAIAQDTLALARKQRTFFKQLPVGEVAMLAAGEKASAKMLFG